MISWCKTEVWNEVSKKEKEIMNEVESQSPTVVSRSQECFRERRCDPEGTVHVRHVRILSSQIAEVEEMRTILDVSCLHVVEL